MQSLSFINVLDILAALVFLGGWIGYSMYTDSLALNRRPVAVVMNDYRLRWMERMLERENRMPDVNIAVALVRSCTVFISTTVLLLAGSLAMLGQVDNVRELISGLKYARATDAVLLELQLMSLTVIFVYAFFTFVWAMRLFNNMLVLLGAAPQPKDVDEVIMREYPPHMARFCGRAFLNMNRGTRAYTFGLGLLPWLVHPVLLMISTVVVILVLYRRDFRSVSLEVLEDLRAHH